MEVRLKRFIFEKGYDKKFGADLSEEQFRQYVEDPLAGSILEEAVSEG